VEKALATRYWEVPEMKELRANELRADALTVGASAFGGGSVAESFTRWTSSADWV
jgi:hypothetical protein